MLILCWTILLSVNSVRAVLLRNYAQTTFNFRLANYFQDGMVLLFDEPSSVLWGYGQPGAKAQVVIFGESVSVDVNDAGIWKTNFWIHILGGPFEIDVYQIERGNRTGHIRLRDVYFGEVFLCGGGANMAFPLAKMFNGSEELASSSQFPRIRLLRIAPASSSTEWQEPRILQNWTVASPDSLKDFSALCWATGRRVYEDLRTRFDEKGSIGLIGAYEQADFPVRSWTPPDSIEQCPGTMPHPANDSGLWNAMIAPLKELRLTSVIWYQGEADATINPDTYGCLLQAMVDGWRKHFYHDIALPFGIVQLGTRNADTIPGATARLRWEQTAGYGQVPNAALVRVFMASAMDLADPESPFGSELPRFKEEIAQRLLAGIVSVLYYRHIPFQGPFPQRVQYAVIRWYCAGIAGRIAECGATPPVSRIGQPETPLLCTHRVAALQPVFFVTPGQRPHAATNAARSTRRIIWVTPEGSRDRRLFCQPTGPEMAGT
ncbi:sialate O-acetylesterase-like isoform X2 [Paramacrobiotus metropolitanus]|uniref:sialate O-acetylesterase-like isoform X2 n=1 Tax=Paramacrobiotus metropolitanus TaxID=2943436 RepID=UPI002445A3E8|nr:sialate O-acetylesterase-like isoform X2 [Paramacrobiotus metropolitanus]